MKNKLYLPSLCLFGILFFGCETAPKKAPPKGEQKETITTPLIEKKSDAPFSRFQNEIDNFIQQDKDHSFSKNGIMMTGSSSIRMWTSMEEDFSAFPVLNRGFGGATIPEVLHFAGRYIFQHEPQIIVFYCGENDISEGVSPETVFASFKTFVKIIETKLPETKLVYISMKPSIARWNLWPQYQAGEKLIKEFVDGNSKIAYMDASISMLEKNGEVKKDIFIEDGLHMNAKGYEGWTNQLKPILEKMYQSK
ncbi:MAG: lysophospholipase L1-like esterase [Granulosicoccus sp.]|jgi:lysophospholipase L1-like esterase